MQTFIDEDKKKCRIFFDELETNNIVNALDNNVCLRNLEFCDYVESKIAKKYNKKRAMLVNVTNGSNYINAIVLLQDISIDYYKKPKKKSHLLKISEILFPDKKTMKKWLINHKYAYKIKNISQKGEITALIFNMSTFDEMDLNVGRIINISSNPIEYMIKNAYVHMQKSFT